MEEIGTSIASKIVEKPVALIGRQLSYLIYYDSNIESLKDVLKNLDDKKNDVQRSVDAAKRNGATIKNQVQSWLENVSKIFREVEELEKNVNKQRRCLYGLCPSLKSRYSLSRKAKKIAERVLDLKLDKGLSNNVANLAPLQQLWSIISSEGFKGFESRKDVMNDVLSALRNEKTRIIGICGMGGVGKTTMVREIIKRLEGMSLFDDVVMATVSATINMRTIQTTIAQSLGMKFVDEIESIIAQRLHERIKQSKRILIILDDVWSELKFQDVGIPFGVGLTTNQVHEGCKILLTSRNEEVCKVMGCKDDIFRVQALNKEEAWKLFRATAGESFDNDPEWLRIAEMIADECKGLPIAIVTVGKALLSSNGKHEWLTALHELKNSVPENIPGMEHNVYSCIKLSYDKLESDEVKSCFLFCCLFPEDYDVPIEYLVRYGSGRATFRNTNTVEDVRNKVHSFVGQLKRRYLLLDSLEEECIKMHDIVRDVAISIASKDPHRFMVRSFDAKGGGGGRPGVQKVTNQEHCSAISLIDFKLDENIIDGLECPKLELLQLKNSSSSSEYSNYFKRMKELKVLAFLEVNMSSYLALEKSLLLGEPKYLHTLCLEDCILGDISHVIGGLESLEILSFARSKISKLPIEIGHLQRLRMLDATDCKRLEEIPHGVLSNLRRLEELYMAESFLNWGPATGSKDETSLASLDEVMSLSDHLNVLAIKIPDVQMLRNDEFLLKSQPIRFHVSINISWSYEEESFENQMPGYLFENSLMLRGDVKEYLEIGAVRYFLKQSEDLSLHHTYNLKYVIEELDGQGGFQHLKVLSIDYDNDIEYLLNGTDWTHRGQPAFPILKSVTLENIYKLKVVCRGKLPDKHSFMNLRSIHIDHCCELKYVFSLSVAQNLVQLQSLNVEHCDEVEQIISKERMEANNASHMITFPRLTVLKLYNLPKLLGFYTENQWDSTYEIIKPNDESVNKMKETRNDNQVSGSTSSKSKVVQVGASCNALFPSNCISWLPNLEELVMVYLIREQQSEDSLTSEQGSKENNEPVVNVVFDLEGHDSAFSQLQTFKVQYLNEEHLWKNVQPGFQGFQNVRSLTIEGCDCLKYLCPYEIYKLLVNLQEVEISSCDNMETIVLEAASTEDNIHEEGKETGGSGTRTLFPKLLNSLCLKILPSLERFCPDAYSFAWSSSTRTMYVRNCPKLKTLSFAPVSKKLPAAVVENLSDDHVRDREESGSGCASSTGSGSGFGCAPLVCLQSRPSTRNFTQILSRPVNREVTPANLQTSSARDNNLEDLHVKHCDLLEVIFLVQETPSTQAFDKLRKLKLYRLAMLSHIWEKGLQVSSGFGNLRFLDVRRCDNLRYLFSPHIAKLLTCLETIEVSDCNAMEKIVGEAEGEGESIKDELTFPHVNSIELEDLPKLESFCSQAYTLKWSLALEKVRAVLLIRVCAYSIQRRYGHDTSRNFKDPASVERLGLFGDSDGNQKRGRRRKKEENPPAIAAAPSAVEPIAVEPIAVAISDSSGSEGFLRSSRFFSYSL
ncbi:probable disease resistance protein At4g27220 [Prunus avium]|uniref:Probable disease resistance protein At4g27220 n=1 Tax=Prunus avium TaxID=42229 RepID=A0A6P5U4B2_PRUAV|nr:probable disease resistance protein At4g27220 [Prunus avium]